MNDEKRSEADKAGKKVGFVTISWPTLRKIEGVIFLAMFLAVPLFAYRVMQYTHAQLVVRHVTRLLTNDLQRAKSMAMERKIAIKVAGISMPQGMRTYAISNPAKVQEEVILPENLSVVGDVTFRENGEPERPSSFIVSSFNRTNTVEIDKTGVISVP